MALVLTIILLIIPLVWTLTDPRSYPERFKHYFSFKSILIFSAEFLFVLLTFLSYRSFSWPGTVFNGLEVFAGLIMFVLGMIISVWAKIEMKAKWGLPGELDTSRQNKVISSGPFSYSRNPIYLGFFLVILGYALTLRSYTILLIPFAVFYFYRAILKEEEILTKHFGKEYLKYKSKVRRFI